MEQFLHIRSDAASSSTRYLFFREPCEVDRWVILILKSCVCSCRDRSGLRCAKMLSFSTCVPNSNEHDWIWNMRKLLSLKKREAQCVRLSIFAEQWRYPFHEIIKLVFAEVAMSSSHSMVTQPVSHRKNCNSINTFLNEKCFCADETRPLRKCMR